MIIFGLRYNFKWRLVRLVTEHRGFSSALTHYFQAALAIAKTWGRENEKLLSTYLFKHPVCSLQSENELSEILRKNCVYLTPLFFSSDEALIERRDN